MLKTEETPIKQIQKLHRKFNSLIDRPFEVSNFYGEKKQLIVNDVSYVKDKNGLPFVLIHYQSLSNKKTTDYNKLVIYNYQGKKVAFLNYKSFPSYNYIKLIQTDYKYRNRHLATILINYLEDYTKKYSKNKDITLICLDDEDRKSNINSNLAFYSNLNYKIFSENSKPNDMYIEMYKYHDDLKTLKKPATYKQKGKIFVKEKQNDKQ